MAPGNMKRVITVTLNPCFDTTLYCEDFCAGQVCRTSREETVAAGKGVNVSKLLKRLGILTTTVLLAGEENFARFEKNLSGLAGTIRAVQIPGRIRENITLQGKHKALKINRKGFTAGPESLQRLYQILLEELSEGDILVFSGSLPAGLHSEHVLAFLRRLKRLGARIAVDNDGLPYSFYTELKPWLVKPNRTELETLLGRAFASFQDVEKAARDMLDAGVETMLVSLGAQGILGLTPQYRCFVKAPPVKAVSDVGAGDSALAGFISANLWGWDFAQSVRFACACGSATVECAGSALCSKQNADLLFNSLQQDENENKDVCL